MWTEQCVYMCELKCVWCAVWARKCVWCVMATLYIRAEHCV